MISEAALRFVESRRVARLGTLKPDGSPHVVPICFALCNGRIYSALDEKPKRRPVEQLQRVRNIQLNPGATLLADRYSENWSLLAYVILRGDATVVSAGEAGHSEAVRALRDKYPQYRSMALDLAPLLAFEPASAVEWGRLTDRGATAEDALAAISSRRSVRWFTSERVTPDELSVLLEAGSAAPSPHGRQPWRFVVLESAEAKRRLAESMAEEWRRQLRMDGQPEDIVTQRLQRSQERILGAPLLVILCLYLQELDKYPDAARAAAEETMAVQSLGAAAENMLIAARALGLDGGWMCAPLFCPGVVRDVFALPAELAPHALLGFGRLAREPQRRPRRPVEELVVLRA